MHGWLHLDLLSLWANLPECLDSVPEVVFRLDSACDGILHMLGCLLALWGDGTIVNEGLEGLPVFVLKHHFKLFPAGFMIISFFSIDLEGLQVIDRSGIECSAVL